MKACERCGAVAVRPRTDRDARFCSRRCGGLAAVKDHSQTRADVATAVARLGVDAPRKDLARLSGYHENTVRRHLRAIATESATTAAGAE